MRAQERAALADAADVAGARHQRGLPAAAIGAAVASRAMRPDQRLAFDHAVAAGGLKIIEGRAGTGKSYVLQAIRDAHEQAGRRVIGLAPTNAVAQDLKADGFSEAGTAHAELFRLKNGRTHWDRRTVVIVDEAAMMDSRVTGEVLGEARRSGAKVILAGDDRQLASIERGGLFTEMRQRHGAAEITEITRQRSDWQRAAARDLAEGRFGDAVAAFDRAGAITWTRDHEDARAALVAAWKRDTAAEPDATRFVFAYTNIDVDALNAELRQVRRDRGELAGDRHAVRDEARRGGLRAGRPGAVHRHAEIRAHLQRQCRHHHRDRRRDRRDPGADWMPRRGRKAARLSGPPPNSSGSGTATRGRSTKGRGGPWTTPTSTTRITGDRRRATWR